MEERTISADGAVVYWQLQDTSRDALVDGLKAIDLAEYAPNEKTDVASLKASITQYLADHKPSEGHVKQVVPKAKAEDGFEVWDFEQAETGQRNQPVLDFTAHLVPNDPDGNEMRVEITDGYADQWTLQRGYERAKRTLNGAAVGNSMVRILKHLGGTALRQSGAVYWIPSTSLPKWESVAQAVEGSCISKVRKSIVFKLTTRMDEGTLRAVKHAIVEEIASEVADINQRVFSGELGEKAMETQKTRAEGLYERIKLYEGIIGEALDGLREGVKVAEKSMTTMTLKSM